VAHLDICLQGLKKSMKMLGLGIPVNRPPKSEIVLITNILQIVTLLKQEREGMLVNLSSL
jgi:hypothetical protein